MTLNHMVESSLVGRDRGARRVVGWIRTARRSVPTGLFGLLSLGVLAGCQTRGPGVDGVWSKTRIMTVPAGEEDLFLRDRASGLTTEGLFLPADKQGEEFFVRWHGAKIDRVKFEYRQLKAPDQVGRQEYLPQARQHSHVFLVGGVAYQKGGTVSGWHVSLWTGDQLVAETKSALW